MGLLNEIAAIMLNSGAQKEIAEKNPYYKLSSIPSQLGEEAIKMAASNPTRFKWKEALPYSIGGALLGGLLEGVGDTYQDRKTAAYENTLKRALQGDLSNSDDLSPSLFAAATKPASIFRIQKEIEEEDAERALGQQEKLIEAQEKRERNKELLRIAARNPQRYKQLVAAGAGESFGKLPSGGASIDESIEEVQEPETSRGMEGAITDLVSEAANQLMVEGAAPEQAFVTARQMYAPKLKELDRHQKNIEEAQETAQKYQLLADRAEAALENIGYTGPGGETAQALSGIAGFVGSESQNEKYSAGQLLEALRGKIIDYEGQGFKGAMSDKEAGYLLQGGPGVDKTEGANAEILGNMRYIANINNAYAEFMRNTDKTSVRKAEEEWQQIRKEHPYLIKGNLNPFWQASGSARTPKIESITPETIEVDSLIDTPEMEAGAASLPQVGDSYQGKKVVSVRKIK